MKKFLSLLTVIFCLFCCSIVVNAGEVTGGSGGEEGKGDWENVGIASGVENGTYDILQYKISLYRDISDMPERTNGYDNFECIGRKIYFNHDDYTKSARVAEYDKFYYATQYVKMGKLEDVPFSYTSLSNVKVGTYDFPTYNAGDAGRGIEYYFSDEDRIRFFVNDLAAENKKTIDLDNDTWVLLVEPILGCHTPDAYEGSRSYYYLTATELALSYSRTKGKNNVIYNGYFNPYYLVKYGEEKGEDLLGGRPGWGAINHICSRLSVINGNGNWLGLSNSTAVNGSWGKSNEGSSEASYTVSNWSTVSNDIMRHGGVGIYYSKAFDFPDYTVEMGNIGDKWENETIDVFATVENSNPARGNKIRVTLNYDKGNITFIDPNNEQTQEIDMNGRSAYEVKWTINVGTYDQTISSDEDRKRSFYVTVEAVPENNKPTELITNNNKTEIKSFHLKRDFSVQNLTVNGQTVTEVKEKTDVIVRFSIANNNPHKIYEDVEVKVKIKRPNGTTELAKQTVSFDEGQTKNCELVVNVGNVTANSDQMFTVFAEINLNKAWHEPNLSNNITDENKFGKIIVTRDINFSMKIIAGAEIGTQKQKYSNNNAGLTSGGRTTGMITCIINNISGFNMHENNYSEDRLYAIVNSPVNKTSSPVCVPANGTNITWFQFTVPNSTSVTFTGQLKWTYKKTFYYTDEEGNVHSYRKDVDVYFTATPDTAGIDNITVNAPDDTNLVADKNEKKQLVETDSSEYSSASAYVVNRAGYPRVARWEQWKINGNTFVLHRYALAGEVKKAQMTPANFGQDTEYVNANGQIASGSAFTLDFQYDVMTESSRGDAVSPSAYTLVQNGIARFPEFKYQLGNKKTRTLFFKNDSIDSKTMFFNTNQYADDVNGGGATPENHIGQRVHFTPLNMPDGKYKVAVEAYDLWTPAGMIYVISTPSLEISGSIFDYNYMN